MIDYAEFIQKFNWNHTQPIHENPEMNTRVYIGLEINEPAQEVVIKQVSRTFSFTGNLIDQSQTLQKEVRRSLEECHALLLGQGTHSAKVKGMALRCVQEKQGSTEYKLESYICFEKMDSDLDKYFFEQGNELRREDFHRLVQSSLEMLQYFEEHSIYHNDIRPSNIGMSLRTALPSGPNESQFEFKIKTSDYAWISHSKLFCPPDFDPIKMRTKISMEELT